MNIQIKKINELAKIPSKSSEDDAGYDISSCEDVTIQPMSRQLVKTGICISVPGGLLRTHIRQKRHGIKIWSTLSWEDN